MTVDTFVGDLAGGAAVAGLGFWFVVSVCNQIPWTKRIRAIHNVVAYDVLGLIPIWTFFAPNPGNTDLHLLSRERWRTGEVTPWRELRFGHRRRVTSLWNPRRRANKAVVDVSVTLTKQARGDGLDADRGVVLSFPYLLVLSHVTSQQHDFGAEAVQFALARTTGYQGRREPSIFFVSAFHSVSDDGLGQDKPERTAVELRAVEV